MSHIQAVLFDTKHNRESWNTSDAKTWLRRHKLKPIKKVHHTEHFLHYRIREPDEEKYKYRTLKLGSGIELIIEFPKKEKLKDPDHPIEVELSNESSEETGLSDLANAAVVTM